MPRRPRPGRPRPAGHVQAGRAQAGLAQAGLAQAGHATSILKVKTLIGIRRIVAAWMVFYLVSKKYDLSKSLKSFMILRIYVTYLNTTSIPSLVPAVPTTVTPMERAI